MMQLLYLVPPFKNKILSLENDGLVSTNLGYIFAKLEYSFLSSIRSHNFIKNFLD